MIEHVTRGDIRQYNLSSADRLGGNSILFYGDPHGIWEPLLEAVQTKRPDAVLIVGDLTDDKRQPETVELARVAIRRLLDAGVDVRLISGNHDTATVAAHDLVFDEFRNQLLDGRVTELGPEGVRVAGLGGVFRGRVWYPSADEATRVPPQFRSPDDLLASTPRSARFREGIPLKQRTTIFPETVETMARQQADILVCHEAPSVHRNGFGVIDQLAADMGARLIVHGHHHQSYSARTASGLYVRGLGLAEVWELSEGEIRGGITVAVLFNPMKSHMKDPNHEDVQSWKAHLH